METFELQIPAEVLPQVITAFSSSYGYESNKLDGESEGDFAKRMVVNFVEDTVKSYQLQQFRLQQDEIKRQQEEQINNINLNIQ